jgi:hypothetical protein
MNTIETGPSNNARDSKAWSRSWTHFSVDRRLTRGRPTLASLNGPPTPCAILIVETKRLRIDEEYRFSNGTGWRSKNQRNFEVPGP